MQAVSWKRSDKSRDSEGTEGLVHCVKGTTSTSDHGRIVFPSLRLVGNEFFHELIISLVFKQSGCHWLSLKTAVSGYFYDRCLIAYHMKSVFLSAPEFIPPTLKISTMDHILLLSICVGLHEMLRQNTVTRSARPSHILTRLEKQTCIYLSALL